MNRSYFSNDLIQSQIKLCTQFKKSFIVREIGSSIEIELPNAKFRGKDPNCLVPGVHLAAMIKGHVKKRVENGDYVPINQDNNRVNVKTVCFNPENIKKLIDYPCVSIDINACYWTTAHNIGVIDDKFYKYGIDNPDWKRARNIAIGSLGTIVTEKRYVDGQLISAVPIRRPYNVVRLDIIDHVWETAQSMIKELKNDFCMYLTDCFYVKRDAEQKVFELLKEHGYTAKKEYVYFDDIQMDISSVYIVSYSKGNKESTYLEFNKNHLI
jgi:hypothetical protein